MLLTEVQTTENVLRLLRSALYPITNPLIGQIPIAEIVIKFNANVYLFARTVTNKVVRTQVLKKLIISLH